jgi:hypothetical protein
VTEPPKTDTLTYFNLVKNVRIDLHSRRVQTFYGLEFVHETCTWFETWKIGFALTICVETWTWFETWAICVETWT